MQMILALLGFISEPIAALCSIENKDVSKNKTKQLLAKLKEAISRIEKHVTVDVITLR